MENGGMFILCAVGGVFIEPMRGKPVDFAKWPS